MKIVISAATDNIYAEIDPRFGRSAYLIWVDTETFEWHSFDNPGIQASGGAGIKAAQFVAEKGADAIISGDFGPNAFDALSVANIPMYVFGKRDSTVRAIVNDFKSGKLQAVGKPTRAGEHGH